MQRQRRSYIDRRTGEILLMEWDTRNRGWTPAMQTMESWRQGQMRLYTPTDAAHMVISMPGHGRWPQLDDTEEDEIHALLEHPWIPDGQSLEGLREDQIEDLDALQHLLTADVDEPIQYPTDGLLDAILRPTLTMPTPYIMTTPPRRTHQPSLLDIALLASLSSAGARPAAAAAPPPPPPAFPRHLADQVLAAAEANQQTCPITMEPIQKATAAITSCGHVFQKEALTAWMQDHNTCPECRQPCAL